MEGGGGGSTAGPIRGRAEVVDADDADDAGTDPHHDVGDGDKASTGGPVKGRAEGPAAAAECFAERTLAGVQPTTMVFNRNSIAA